MEQDLFVVLQQAGSQQNSEQHAQLCKQQAAGHTNFSFLSFFFIRIWDLSKEKTNKTSEMMKTGDDHLTPSQDKRITLLESKMFAMMACNDELVAKVDSLEKNIAEKEENFDLLLNHSKRQDEKLETLKSMFKDILDESENLAFSFSLIEQKEKDNAEHFR